MSTPSDEKSRLRRRMRDLRAALPASKRAAESAAIVRSLLAWDWSQLGPRVAVYLAMPTEANIDEFTLHLLRNGRALFAPCHQSTLPFARVRDLSDIPALPSGLREPPGGESCNASELDLIFVPGLAFDARGGRLGQGGGWYDRVLQVTAPAGGPLTVGVGYDCQLIEAVPQEAHDRVLDAVVTPSRCFDASGRLGLKLKG